MSRISDAAFFRDLLLGFMLFWGIPTGFFMLIGLFVHTVRAPVNVDYFFLSLLFPLLSRRVLWDDGQVPYMIFRPKRAHQMATTISDPPPVGQGRRTASILAPH